MADQATDLYNGLTISGRAFRLPPISTPPSTRRRRGHLAPVLDPCLPIVRDRRLARIPRGRYRRCGDTPGARRRSYAARFPQQLSHRGSALCIEQSGRFKGALIVCPYHAWSYRQDGHWRLFRQDRCRRVSIVPSMASLPLPWRSGAGFVFVNLASNPALDVERSFDGPRQSSVTGLWRSFGSATPIERSSPATGRSSGRISTNACTARVSIGTSPRSCRSTVGLHGTPRRPRLARSCRR